VNERYEVLEELGRGGMGVVHKARQVSLNRVVALKMLLAGLHSGAKERARFNREADLIARLQHPNIVQVYEKGEDDGIPFLAMEFCRSPRAPPPPRSRNWPRPWPTPTPRTSSTAT
jgi:serine/threonine protein kinase